MKAIEKKMAQNHNLQCSQMRECGMALSDLNEKLYYCSIDHLLRSKSAKAVEQYIESVTVEALKRMKCPDRLIKEGIKTNTVIFDFQMKQRDGTGTAKRVDSEQKKRQIRLELDALNRDIEGLRRERAQKAQDAVSWERKRQEMELKMSENMKTLQGLSNENCSVDDVECALNLFIFRIHCF